MTVTIPILTDHASHILCIFLKFLRLIEPKAHQTDLRQGTVKRLRTKNNPPKNTFLLHHFQSKAKVVNVSNKSI